MPKKRATITTKVENAVVLALSGFCTVRYSAGRLREVTITLDGVRPPLVLVLDRPASGETRVNVSSGTIHVDGLTRATDVVHEIGHYIATSTGAESGVPEKLTR